MFKAQFDYINKEVNLTKIFNIKKIYGGDINNNFYLESKKGNFFVKINDEYIYPKMLLKEKKALKTLIKFASINIPKPIFVGQHLGKSILVLQWIEKSNTTKKFWVEFGKKLAKTHKKTDTHFGLDHDNYIGNLPQFNKKEKKWVNFFINQRLEPQLKIAFDKLYLDKSILPKFKKLFSTIPNLFPENQPSLIHGDLWNGNFICDKNKNPYIFDPAIYYGNREMDIAMSKLFGGFDNIFYESYNDQFPLEKGWEDRMDLCNLYPLMVHLNIFGTSYLSSVENIINKYT